VASEFLTISGVLEPAAARGDKLPGQINLSWLDVNASFATSALPVHIGRVAEAEFVVNDPRVSRRHQNRARPHAALLANAQRRYATWLPFTPHGTQAQTEPALRHQ